jgi:pSer/pThr/pTyr-binding forkhead associated (FHA) protein
VPHPDPSGPVLVLDSGERITLQGCLLVGRDPVPEPDEPRTELLAVEDPGRSVSRTHLAVGATPDGRVWVVDRHSTNGVRLVDSSGVHDVVPGETTYVVPGAVIRFGDRRLEVR